MLEDLREAHRRSKATSVAPKNMNAAIRALNDFVINGKLSPVFISKYNSDDSTVRGHDRAARISPGSTPCEEKAWLLAIYGSELRRYQSQGDRRERTFVRAMTHSKKKSLSMMARERCESARMNLKLHGRDASDQMA